MDNLFFERTSYKKALDFCAGLEERKANNTLTRTDEQLLYFFYRFMSLNDFALAVVFEMTEKVQKSNLYKQKVKYYCNELKNEIRKFECSVNRQLYRKEDAVANHYSNVSNHVEDVLRENYTKWANALDQEFRRSGCTKEDAIALALIYTAKNIANSAVEYFESGQKELFGSTDGFTAFIGKWSLKKIAKLNSMMFESAKEKYKKCEIKNKAAIEAGIKIMFNKINSVEEMNKAIVDALQEG